MHIEILVEDSSGKKLLEEALPKILKEHNDSNSFRVHPYKGIGNIPKDLRPGSDPAKRILLDQLPRLLRGYGRTPAIDAVVVVLDSDRRDCVNFLRELHKVLDGCDPAPRTLFRLAIEEIEAWYFGDREALMKAYPGAKKNILDNYQQDSICGTWESLADAIYPGGSSEIKRAGWPLPGQVKHEWAENIGPLLDPDRNQSPSFRKLKEGIRRLVIEQSE